MDLTELAGRSSKPQDICLRVKPEQLQRWHSCWASLRAMVTGRGWLAQGLPEALLPSASRIQLGCLLHPFRLSQNHPALKKMDFKGISLVLTWCSAGQQKSSQLCPRFPEEAVLGFPWHLSSLCRVTWLWRCPFFRTDEVNGRSAETSFWKSQWMQGRRGNFPYLIFHLNLPFWNLGWLHLCSNL